MRVLSTSYQILVDYLTTLDKPFEAGEGPIGSKKETGLLNERILVDLIR
jgi:hypothetical protein